jgi:PAS domain S-box-containing protein
MAEAKFRRYIEAIRRYAHSLRDGTSALDASDEITGALYGLELIYEGMLSSLEAAESVQEELFLQNQQLADQHQRARELFQALPMAYLVTNANGLILEANQAISDLLKVPQSRLLGKPLALFVADSERKLFYTILNRLEHGENQQRWHIRLAPRDGQAPFVAELRLNVMRNQTGVIENLWIGVSNLSQPLPETLSLTRAQPESAAPAVPIPSLPQSLDGLQVLFVDDEADAREFVTAVLEAKGIKVTAIDSAAAALEAIAQNRPDVLVSDIRMAEQDGYELIRRVRELEAEQGWHVPAAALTAYLDESREKTLAAGFEAHLHKLAQPDDLVALVSRLSGRAVR